MQVGHGHLCGRDEVERPTVHFEEVLLELGQVSGPFQRVRLDEVGREDLGVAVAPGVEIQHERDERALEHGPGPAVHHETGAAYLGRPLKIENTQGRPELVVGLWGEVETGLFPPDRDLDVGRFVPSVWNGFVGDIRQVQQVCADRLVEFDDGSVHARNLLAQGPHLGLNGRRVLALSLEPSDRLACFVTARLEGLHAGDQLPAPPVERENIVYRGAGHTLSGELPLDLVRTGSDEVDIQHVTACVPEARCR